MSKLTVINGTTRYNVSRQVVRLRTKDLLSWQAIANMLEISPRTARKLFQERTGEHQHHDHIIGKGGRWPQQWDTPAEFPYIVELGVINEWGRIAGSDLVDA